MTHKRQEGLHPSPGDHLQWWREARFGMFVHWGLYSQLARGEWVMNRDCMLVAEYEKLAAAWQPRPGCIREWARQARQAGMKYMIMTAKHHEGFCLWNTAQTDYNAVQRGPGRDLVAEYVAACRAEGLKVGIYYSLMDWHHPDGWRCREDEAARRRFLDFTQGCVRELLSNYGRIDILFYDVSLPLASAEAWESAKMNAMARALQPGLIINDRAMTPEDYGTPEGHVNVLDRDWEVVLTTNDGEWCYSARPEADWISVRKIIYTLRECAAGGGNLCLNVGPTAAGGLDPQAVQRLATVGRWAAVHGEAFYGPMERTKGKLDYWASHGFWTLKDKNAYLWNVRSYPQNGEMIIGGLDTPPTQVSILGCPAPLTVERRGLQTIVRGLPRENPEPLAGTPVFKFEFAEPPRQAIGFYPWQEPRHCLRGDAADVALAANLPARDERCRVPPPIVLRSNRLTVEMAHPDAGLGGTRFDRTAWITQVRLDAGTGHPGHTFCVAESFVPGQGCGGAGLCSEFDLEAPAGYAQTRPGDEFAKLGVGLLRRPDAAAYSFARPYPVTRLFPVQVAVTATEAVFTTEPLACGGIAARVVRRVVVRENELYLATTLENVGDKPLHTREYVHNFVGFDKYPLGPGYRLQWSAPLTPLPVANAEAARVREDLLLDGATVRLRQTPQHAFYCQFTGAQQSPGPQWELRYEPHGLGMSESVDFSPALVALWGESHVISPEIFVALTINPGETRHWSRRYRFDHGG